VVGFYVVITNERYNNDPDLMKYLKQSGMKKSS